MSDDPCLDDPASQARPLKAAQTALPLDLAPPAAQFTEALFESGAHATPWLDDQLEDRLRREHNFILAVLETVSALIVVLDRDGRIVRFNKACERATGYRLDEMLGCYVWDKLLVPEEIEPVKAVFHRLRAGDFPLNFENYWVAKDGQQRLIAWSNTILMTDDGAVDYVIGTGIDITEQRAAEQEIKHMSSFPQLNPNPVLEVDPAGNIVFCNAGALKALEQIDCEPDPRRFLPPDLPAIIDVLRQPQAPALQREIQIADAYFAESLYRAPGFETIRIFATDITARKQVEEQLRYQAFVLENIFDAIIATDLDFHILNWNKAAEELYGWQAVEVIGKRGVDVLQSQLITPRDEVMRQLYETGCWKGEVIHQCKDGHTVHILASTRLLRSAAGTPIGIVSANRDITDRKQAEEALRHSEERYALAQRAANIGSWDWNIVTGQLHWSDRLEPLFGLRPGTFGGTYEDFLNFVHPEDRQAVVDAVAASIETGKDYAIEHRVIWPNGEVHWIAETGDVFRDEHGRALRMLGVAQDVTERRQFLATLQESNAELQVRNEELNAFAHTVAHDIKSPLQLIIAASDLLNDYYGATLPEDALLPLEILVKGGHKLNTITDSLLLLSEVRRGEVQLEPLCMGAIVAETWQRLGSQLDATVEICLPDTWPLALGYAPWIEEVWSNFLINALKYGCRPLRIELGSDRLPTGMICFWVHDNGVGISPAVQANLFTTTNLVTGPRRRGHGLGLSIVKRIVEKLGGEVGMQSSGVPGEGCEFSFTLPAA